MQMTGSTQYLATLQTGPGVQEHQKKRTDPNTCKNKYSVMIDTNQASKGSDTDVDDAVASPAVPVDVAKMPWLPPSISLDWKRIVQA